MQKQPVHFISVYLLCSWKF